MNFIKKYLFFVFLFSFVNCDLLKKELSNLTRNIENVVSLDNNQKQAFVLFKDLLGDKQQYSEYLEKKRQEVLSYLQDNPNMQKKLSQKLNCDYDESKINGLFVQLGIEKTKEFLQQLHLMIGAINDGTLASFEKNSNFYDDEVLFAQEMTLEKKKERGLKFIKVELYTAFYFYSNDINDADYFHSRVMAILSTE